MRKQSQKRRLLINVIATLLSQVVAIVCNLILPIYFIRTFGSPTYGLTASIKQFLGFITLGEMGMGAVVQSSLYKPLIEKDTEQISRIYKAAREFYNRVGFGVLIYMIGLTFLYPLIVSDGFDYFYTASLVAAISISSFAEFYFGITYRTLLEADQKKYIQVIPQILSYIVNVIVSIILMKLNASLVLIKFVSSLIFLSRPLFMASYVKRHYNLDNKAEINKKTIEQKWNGIAQHLAQVVFNNTDVIVLTFFSTMSNVSIYSVYFLVVKSIQQFLESITINITSVFGQMKAKNDNKFITSFAIYETFSHILITCIFTIAIITVIPFISIYTKNITDTNYLVPEFAFLIMIAHFLYSTKNIYHVLIKAEGHYKQTQTCAIIEALINIIVSIITVDKFGLIGVAFGTLLAMIYRTIYYSIYLQSNIIMRNKFHMYKHYCVDSIILGLAIVLTKKFNLFELTYASWIIYATKVGLYVLVIDITAHLLFYKQECVWITKMILFNRKNRKNINC